MPIVQFWNERVRRMNIFDVKLVQLAAICAALVIVKLVPAIMSVSIWWFVALMIISAIRPLMVVFRSDSPKQKFVASLH